MIYTKTQEKYNKEILHNKVYNLQKEFDENLFNEIISICYIELYEKYKYYFKDDVISDILSKYLYSNSFKVGIDKFSQDGNNTFIEYINNVFYYRIKNYKKDHSREPYKNYRRYLGYNRLMSKRILYIRPDYYTLKKEYIKDILLSLKRLKYKYKRIFFLTHMIRFKVFGDYSIFVTIPIKTLITHFERLRMRLNLFDYSGTYKIIDLNWFTNLLNEKEYNIFKKYYIKTDLSLNDIDKPDIPILKNILDKIIKSFIFIYEEEIKDAKFIREL